MVYESDFYTRRSYARPSVSSYSVSYPFYRYLPSYSSYPFYRYEPSYSTYPYYRYVPSYSTYPFYRYQPSYSSYPFYRYVPSYSSYPIYRHVPSVSKVYRSTYPIYSYHSVPYVAHKRLVTGTRVLSSPVRVITSPIRVIRSTRVIRTPVRVVTSPTRYYTTPVREVISPIRTITPIRVISSPTRYLRETSVDYDYLPSIRTPHSVYARELDRIAHKVRPRVGYHPLEEYLNSESFINFDSETRRIRSDVQSLLREIHTPVIRRARSSTPFPVTRYYDPVPSYALDAYLSRVTNPLRNIASDVNSLLNSYAEPRKYAGKSHLSSVRYVGNKGFSIRNPLYDPDRIKTDVEYLSRYLKNRRAASEKSSTLVKLASVDAVEAKEVPAIG